jgi:hypothetical protein
MKFFTYEDVPLFLGVSGHSGQYIFAEQANISVNQNSVVKRYLNDNVIRFTGVREYSISQGVSDYTLGPSGGPPQPLSTSIYKIPSGTKVTFPNNKNLYFEEDVSPNGHNYITSLRSYSGYSLSPSESQSGYFNPIWGYASQSAIGGTLSVSFYPNSGNLPAFFNITGISDPSKFPPIDEEKITGHLGNFRFDNAYLKSLSFSVSPNSISRASAAFEIYGNLTEDTSLIDNYYSSSLYSQQSIPHGTRTQIIGTSDNGISNVTNFSYGISVQRIPKLALGTGDRTSTEGLIPTRVAKTATNIQMSIKGESINPNIFSDEFGGKRSNLTLRLHDLSYDNFENNSQGLLHTFNCSGIVSEQSLSVSSEGYLNGSFSIKQNLT